MSCLIILILGTVGLVFRKTQRQTSIKCFYAKMHPALKGGMAHGRIRWYAQDNRGSLMKPCNNLPA